MRNTILFFALFLFMVIGCRQSTEAPNVRQLDYNSLSNDSPKPAGVTVKEIIPLHNLKMFPTDQKNLFSIPFAEIVHYGEKGFDASIYKAGTHQEVVDCLGSSCSLSCNETTVVVTGVPSCCTCSVSNYCLNITCPQNCGHGSKQICCDQVAQ